MVSVICEIGKKKKNKPPKTKLADREQIGDCHREKWREMGEGGQPIQSSSYKINKSWDVIPGGSDGKESSSNAGDLGLTPGLGRYPGGVHGNPLQYSCLENPHGQRSLAGYSP